MKTELYYERAAPGELQAAAEDEDRIRGIREGDRDFPGPPAALSVRCGSRVSAGAAGCFRRTTLVAGAAAACLAVDRSVARRLFGGTTEFGSREPT
jgi:hypothetical protein